MLRALQRLPRARVLVWSMAFALRPLVGRQVNLVQVIAVCLAIAGQCARPNSVVIGLVRRLALASLATDWSAMSLWHGDAPSGPLRELGAQPIHRQSFLSSGSSSPGTRR